MTQEKQRQDAVYAKVALVALVGALVILAGARFLTKKPAPQQPAPPAAKTSKEKPALVKPISDAKEAAAKANRAAPPTPTPAGGELAAKGKKGKSPARTRAIAALLRESSGASSRDPFIGIGKGGGRRPPARENARAAARREVMGDPPPRRASRREDPAEAPETDYTLVGIMRGGLTTATIVDLDGSRYYVHEGQPLGEYRVVKIAADSVVLSQGGTQVTLKMRAAGKGSRDRRSSRPRPRRPRRY